MILKDIAVERFRFDCTHCGHQWDVDYDVQHVEDGHGHLCDYYFRNGLPAIAPTSPHAVVCPVCGATRVWVHLLARRATPPVSRDTGEHGHHPNSDRLSERHQAPLLPAEQAPHAPAEAAPPK